MPVETTMKSEAKKLIDAMPDQASWQDLLDQIALRKAIEDAIEDSREGQLVSQEEIEAHFGVNGHRLANGTSPIAIDRSNIHDLVASLPDEATWDDFFDLLEMHRAIDEGLDDLRHGRVLSDEEMKARYGVDE